jgi:hypothetical protein
MQDLDNLNPHGDRSKSRGQVLLSNISREQTLEEIGGEPLAGSGFEDEEPESDFVTAAEES